MGWVFVLSCGPRPWYNPVHITLCSVQVVKLRNVLEVGENWGFLSTKHGLDMIRFSI